MPVRADRSSRPIYDSTRLIDARIGFCSIIKRIRGDQLVEMQVEELDGGVTNVVLRGRLDSVGAEAIEGPFNAVAGAKRAIVVDLSQVTFLTSRGSPATCRSSSRPSSS